MWKFFRYCLGTFHGTIHFQLLSGIKLGYQAEPYLPILLAVTALTSGITFISGNIKKIKERYRDRKFLDRITISMWIEEGQVKTQFNNMKNNVPLLNGSEMTIMVTFGFLAYISIFISFVFNGNGVANYFYQESMAIFIYKVIIPIVYLATKKNVRNFIWKIINEAVQP